MGIAYFLRVGDKTTCGGTILTGCTNHILDGQPTARHGDSYICGKDKKLYHIVGGQPGYFIHGVQAAGTAHSVGTCPCKCRFINSISNVTYFYESEVLSAPKPVTNRVVSVAPQNAPKPLTMAPVRVKRINRLVSLSMGDFVYCPMSQNHQHMSRIFSLTPPRVRESCITN